jgi:hypothetical protein
MKHWICFLGLLMTVLVSACQTSTEPIPSTDSGGDTGFDAVTVFDTSVDAGSPIDVQIGVDRRLEPHGLSDYITASEFETLFPHRNETACTGSLFTYAAFTEAARAFPAFLTEGTDEQRRRELASFLANISHETTGGWATAPGGPEAWGLCFREEVGCDRAPPTSCQYCVAVPEWPCATGARYYGRGPMQLSYNYNYGPAGRALGVDLLAHPELVAMDGVLAFKTALWFWMTPQSPKPSCHDVMVGRWTPDARDIAAGRRPGFGATINIINGGVECSYALDTPPREAPRNVQDRLRFYAYFTQRFGVSPGENVECGTMTRY